MNRMITILVGSLLVAGCATPLPDAPNYTPAALAVATRQPGVDDHAIAPDKVLGLEECLGIALSNNRSLQIADRRVLIAEDRVIEAWTTVLPQITAEGRYQGRNNDPGASIDGRTTITGERETGFARLSLIVPIYDFGAAANRREALRIGVDVAQLTAESARLDLDLTVTLAYFRVLEARKIRGIVEESIEVIERQLQIAKDFLRQGLVARSDVLSVEVQLAERRQERIQAENNVQLATATLNRLMGVDVTRSTELLDVVDEVPWSGTFEAVLGQAVEGRTDLAALKRQIDIARAEFRAMRAGLAPRIFAFADYSASTDDFLLNKDSLVGGVGVQFPLFDGGTTYARLQRSEKEIAEAADLHDDRVDDIVLEVKKAFLDVRAAAERLPVARKSIEQAEENLRVVQDLYREAQATSADVLTEEERLSRARSSYFRALYDYHEAFARLTRVAGGPPPSH